MSRQERERRPAAAGDGRRGSWTAGEPRLEDVLDDPIVALLWRRDRLEPTSARAAVRDLQALVRGRRRSLPAAPRPGVTAREEPVPRSAAPTIQEGGRWRRWT